MLDRIGSGIIRESHQSVNAALEVQQWAIRALHRDYNKYVPFTGDLAALFCSVKSQRDMELFLSGPRWDYAWSRRK